MMLNRHVGRLNSKNFLFVCASISLFWLQSFTLAADSVYAVYPEEMEIARRELQKK